MKDKRSKNSLLLFLLILMSFNAFSQWKYPNAKNIKDDVIISYEVKYDRELSEKEKESRRFKREVVVIFNENKLLEKTFSNTADFETSSLFDYEKEVGYRCLRQDTKKEAVSSKFRNPVKETMLQEGKVDTILGFPCQVSTTKVKGKFREIYTTKEFGLKYVKKYDTEGFLMKYSANDKYLGTYTVTAKKIFYKAVEETTYSLEGYTIRSKDEQEDYLNKRKEVSSQAKEKAIEKIGKSAPKYTVRSINGKKLKSKNMAGKVVVFNFWFTTCPPCKKEIPQLNELKEKFKNKDVEFIAVALDEEYKLDPFLRQHPFTYDLVEDGRWVAEKFDIESFPSNIIIDKKGTIQFFKIGYKPNIVEAMSFEIEKLLKE